MESKENNDVFDFAADTIMKWYEQTRTNIVKVSSHHDVELMGILLAAESQTSGVLTTLESNHILSTHGLLRILVETYVVLRWILRASINGEKPKSEEVYKRLKSWEYARLRKDKALLESWTKTPEVESAIEKIKKDIKKLKNEGIEELSSYEQLFRDLGGGEPDEVKEWGKAYTIFYRKYSRAVHINRNVTRKLVREQYENGELKAFVYNNDIEPEGDELINIASISSDINKAIRDFYGWQSDAMQNEYEQIRSRLIEE